MNLSTDLLDAPRPSPPPPHPDPQASLSSIQFNLLQFYLKTISFHFVGISLAFLACLTQNKQKSENKIKWSGVGGGGTGAGWEGEGGRN